MSNKRVFDEMLIRISPMAEKIQVEERQDGVTSIKTVALSSVVECFEKSIVTEKLFSSGLLPEGCLSFSVAGSTQEICLWVPAHRADITYHHTVYEGFALPRMVFSFTLNGSGRVVNSRMAIVADEKLRPESQVFAYPFSNVYGNSKICIGSANSLPVYKSIRALTGLPHLILSLPNNDHEFSAARNKLRLPYRELLEHLRDKDAGYYYEQVLIPWKGKSLQHFIDNKLED